MKKKPTRSDVGGKLYEDDEGANPILQPKRTKALKSKSGSPMEGKRQHNKMTCVFKALKCSSRAEEDSFYNLDLIEKQKKQPSFEEQYQQQQDVQSSRRETRSDHSGASSNTTEESCDSQQQRTQYRSIPPHFAQTDKEREAWSNEIQNSRASSGLDFSTQEATETHPRHKEPLRPTPLLSPPQQDSERIFRSKRNYKSSQLPVDRVYVESSTSFIKYPAELIDEVPVESESVTNSHTEVQSTDSRTQISQTTQKISNVSKKENERACAINYGQASLDVMYEYFDTQAVDVVTSKSIGESKMAIKISPDAVEELLSRPLGIQTRARSPPSDFDEEGGQLLETRDTLTGSISDENLRQKSHRLSKSNESLEDDGTPLQEESPELALHDDSSHIGCQNVSTSSPEHSVPTTEESEGLQPKSATTKSYDSPDASVHDLPKEPTELFEKVSPHGTPTFRSNSKPPPFFWRSHPRRTIISYDPIIPHTVIQKQQICDGQPGDKTKSNNHIDNARLNGSTSGKGCANYLDPEVVHKLWLESKPFELKVNSNWQGMGASTCKPGVQQTQNSGNDIERASWGATFAKLPAVFSRSQTTAESD